MDKIVVCDKFLDENELKTALDIINGGSWKYGHNSSGKNLYEDNFWVMNLTDNEFFSKYVLNIIEKHFSRKYRLVRVYANGQTFTQDGHYHTDSNESNTFTFCLYLTKISESYIDTAGGYIYFKLPEQKYNLCYEPLYNRGLYFPSNYIHKGSAFTRYVMDMRICVAWKLELIEDI